MSRKCFYAMPFGPGRATTAASLHDAKPKAVLSFSAVLRQVSLGLPRLLFPTEAQINAVLGCWLASILRMWPMNLQHCRKICSLMVLMLAWLRISSLDTFMRQLIFINLLKFLCKNTSSLVASFLVIRHVSHP